MAQAFKYKLPATLKTAVPIKANGTIALDGETATGYKQINMNFVSPGYVFGDQAGSLIWQNYNSFLEELLTTVFNITFDNYENRVDLTLETWDE